MATIKNWTDGAVQFLDGTGTPITLTIPYDLGDFAASKFKYKLRETSAYQARGILTSVRHGARYFITWSFTAQCAQFTAATAISISDAILKNGSFASAVSTLGASADVYTLDVKFTMEGTNFGDSADHTFTLEDCEVEFEFSEGDPNTFKISGTCYGAVVGDLAM